MKRAMMSVFTIAVLSAVLNCGLAGCADESAPNRRGLERAPLAGRNAQDNAEKRELEPQKRDLPTGGGSEFPGQSMAPMVPADQPVVLLDDVGIVPVTAPAAPGEPATTTAPAATQAVPNAMDPLDEPAFLAPPDRPQKPVFVNDDKPFAKPGAVMNVPGSGPAIAPEWGSPKVLTDYPHRPWRDAATTYESGKVLHNPSYYHFLFAYSDDTGNWDKNQGRTDLEGLGEIPYFFGETLALPVLMVINPPLAQRGTAYKTADALYLGKLPAGGPLVPAPEPGQIRYVYPPNATFEPAATEPTTNSQP